MTVTAAGDGLRMARSMESIALAEAGPSEHLRTLTAPLVEALWSSGLMQFMNPSVAGGHEPGFAELIDTWVEMARQDGSLGWIGIANIPSSCFAAAYLPQEGFDAVFTAHGNRVTMGGQFFPNGTGETVPGGYRLTGKWQFGSGTGHCEYVCAGFLPLDTGQMVMATETMPLMLVAIVPREQVTFTDGWHVQGLKGTGSYDYELNDVFVPASHTYALMTRSPLRGGPLYRFGVMPPTGWWSTRSPASRPRWQQVQRSPRSCVVICGSPPPTPPRPAARSCSGRTSLRAPPPSARVTDWSAPSAICIPARSTRSSARTSIPRPAN